MISRDYADPERVDVAATDVALQADLSQIFGPSLRQRASGQALTKAAPVLAAAALTACGGGSGSGDAGIADAGAAGRRLTGGGSGGDGTSSNGDTVDNGGTADDGGTGDDGSTVPDPTPDEPVPTAVPISLELASRLMTQATMGANLDQIQAAADQGPELWLFNEFKKPRGERLFDWMKSQNFQSFERNGEPQFTVEGLDQAVWRALVTREDQLRIRVAFALSEILVVSVNDLRVWRNFSAADFFDLLVDYAFGNYRTLLGRVSRHQTMARYLTFLSSKKATPDGGVPDENYAREILQLFTIGLHQLNLDGTEVLVGGKPVETYAQEDIMGLARVFTGWRARQFSRTDPDTIKDPVVQKREFHETGEKRFLGLTIPEGTLGEQSLKMALDHIFAHPNVGPFISKQLIQRLVKSNPTPAYVASVAAVFNDNGRGVRGDLRAVVKAILLHNEARAIPTAPTAGKLREPVLRFTAWARAFKASSPDGTWDMKGVWDPALGLGQSPLRSPSVFNFFRPGYVPPQTTFAKANPKLVAPEFQITDEVSVAGYLNFMQRAVFNQLPGVRADYSGWLALADNPGALVDRLNVVLAGGLLSEATKTIVKQAVTSIKVSVSGGPLRRVQAATMLVLASPDFIAYQ